MEVPGLEISNSSSKSDKYAEVNRNLKALFTGEPDITANLANTAAVLKEVFGWLWIGFYRVVPEGLLLGPFQGPVACTRIAFGRGVCGYAYEKAKTIIVPDVDAFPGHIACSSLSRSEIVVPVIKDGRVVMVIDADSDALNHFDEEDQKGLEAIAELISSQVLPL